MLRGSLIVSIVLSLWLVASAQTNKMRDEQLPFFTGSFVSGMVRADSSNQPIWPNVIVDSSNTIYVTASQFSDPLIGFWTVSKDLGATWSPWSDTLAGSYLDYTSWSSGGREMLVTRDNRVAFIIRTALLQADLRLGQLLYYETADQGTTWKKDTIIEYSAGDSLNPPKDSVTPWLGYSGVYDNNYVLHVAYVALDTAPDGGGGGTNCSGWRSQIRYWNNSTQKSTVVASAWWATNPGPGGWHPTISEANIAIDRSSGALYCTWAQADTGDVSLEGWTNLELYCSKSTDTGATWSTPKNITNSRTPGADVGQCENDWWHSISETVANDTVNVFYMNDKNAASGSFGDMTTNTMNPMRFLKYYISSRSSAKPIQLSSKGILSPGDSVGETDYDWQINSGGRRYVCKSPTGGYHFYWSYRKDGSGFQRRPYYRYLQPSNTWSDVKVIDDRCGRMGALSQLKDGRAVATAHVTLDTLLNDYNFPHLYIDSAEGAGKFQIIPLPYLPDPVGIKGINKAFTNTLRVTMSPNPFRNRIEIRLVSAALKGRPVQLSIYATSGRLVKQVSMKEKFVWDGKDANGHRLPAGIYFLRLNAGGLKYSTRMILLK